MLVKSEEQKDTIRLKSDKRLYFYILFLRVKKILFIAVAIQQKIIS
jgi:hypothetical protein